MNLISNSSKATLILRFFSLWKIPLIYYCKPKVVEINDKKCVIKIPFKRRVKNHIKSMYFGALTIGADLAGGLIAMYHIRNQQNKIVFLFKDVKGDFLKRVEGDAYFTFNDGVSVTKAITKAIKTGERVNLAVNITVTCPSQFGDEPVAKFVLTLSLKEET